VSAALLLTLLLAGEAPSPAQEALSRLENPTTYSAALAEVERIAPAHLPDLYAAMVDPTKSDHYRGSVLGVICRLRPAPADLRDVLVKHLADKGHPVSVRKGIANALAFCLSVDAALPEIERALGSTEPEVRKAALRGLFTLREAAVPLMPLLLELIKSDPIPEVRCWSAETIEDLGPQRVKALPALRQAARIDPNSYARDCIRETIEIIASAPPPS
jgi:HEAT repeat protein